MLEELLIKLVVFVDIWLCWWDFSESKIGITINASNACEKMNPSILITVRIRIILSFLRLLGFCGNSLVV